MKNCDRGLKNAARGCRTREVYFQVSGHSFSLYGPTLSRQKADLFFPVVNWLTGRFGNATLPLHWLTCPAGLQNIVKYLTRRYLSKKDVLKNRFIVKYLISVASCSLVQFS